jgi:release factor glutamine methyltransferase
MVYQSREDSLLLVSCISDYAKGKSVLDMCAGSGIQAQAALKAEAKSVLAADIDKEAVILMRKEGINAIHSDLFSNIEGKFDLIICNPPYLPEDKREDKESSLATTGGRRGDEFICRFLEQSHNYLNNNGKILLLVSSLTPKDNINHILKKNNFSRKIIKSESFFMETLDVWLIERVFKQLFP